MTTRDHHGETDDRPTHIPISPASQRFASVFLSLGIAIGILGVTVRPTNSFTTPEITFTAGVITVFLGLVLAVRFIYISLKGVSGVLVHENYLEDLGTPVAFGDLDFSDVIDIRVAIRRKTLSSFENVWVVVVVKNPRRYVENESFLRKWLVRKWNSWRLGSPVAFQAGLLAMPADRFVSLLRRKAGLE